VAPEKAAEKSETEKSEAEKSGTGSASLLNPKATIDQVQKRLDEAAAKDAKRREEMEAQTK
jgi:hypothetical protein